MQTLWNSLGGGNEPRLVNGKTITYYPATSSTEAMLRFGDGECDFEIDVNPVEIIDSLKNDCLQSVYNQLMSGNINNEILKIFNDVFKDGTKFNAFFNDGWVDPEGTDIAEANPRNIVKVGQDLISIDVDLNFDDALLVNYSWEYIAFTFIHEMLHAYYSAKPELFPPGDLNDPELVHHIDMLSQYLEQTAQFIHDLYGSPIEDMKMLALGALKDQVLGNQGNITYVSIKLNKGFTDAQINNMISNYINGGNRCN